MTDQLAQTAEQHETTAARPAQTDGDLPFSTAAMRLVGLGAGIDFDAAHAIISRAAEIGYCLVAGDEILVTANAGRDRFAITTN